MIRLMGILTGSAIAVGLLIITLGVPELSTAPEETMSAVRPVAATQAARSDSVFNTAETQVVSPGADTVAEAPHPEPTLSEPPLPEPPLSGSPLSETPLLETPLPELPPATEPAPVGQPTTTLSDEQLPLSSADNWYAFWSPFRSEIAADGFITELQRTTGLDYRVVKLKPGVYEVAFAYSDDSDIQDKLSRISTATGLDLSGG